MLAPDALLQRRYLVVRQLGRGGMGTVYEAVDRRLSRTVALKENHADTDELRRAFGREARLLANLSHPSLPRVVDHFGEGAGQYLVMDFVPGDDLKTQLELRGHPFEVSDVLRWADDLLDALEYLHSHEPPILHRDIKPANLKMTPRGKVVLLDFGLAKGAAGLMTNVTVSRTVLGYSPHYAPPEQIQGRRTGPRGDLYALAATLHHLLAGQPPPDALTRAASVLNDELDPLEPVGAVRAGVPRHVSSALMRALSLKPALRPVSAAEMRAELRGGVADSSLPTFREPGETTVVRTARHGAGVARVRAVEPPWKSSKWSTVAGALIAVLLLACFLFVGVPFLVSVLREEQRTGAVEGVQSGYQNGGAQNPMPQPQASGATTESSPSAAANTSADNKDIIAHNAGIRRVNVSSMSYEFMRGEYGVLKPLGANKYQFLAEGHPMKADVKFKVLYGDLTGDRKDEVVVLVSGLASGERGLNDFTPLDAAFIYTAKDGRLHPIGEFVGQTTNAPQGMITAVKIRNGQLEVGQYADGPTCCPEAIVTTKYKYNGRELVQAGAARRRKVPHRTN